MASTGLCILHTPPPFFLPPVCTTFTNTYSSPCRPSSLAHIAWNTSHVVSFNATNNFLYSIKKKKKHARKCEPEGKKNEPVLTFGSPKKEKYERKHNFGASAMRTQKESKQKLARVGKKCEPQVKKREPQV